VVSDDEFSVTQNSCVKRPDKIRKMVHSRSFESFLWDKVGRSSSSSDFAYISSYLMVLIVFFLQITREVDDVIMICAIITAVAANGLFGRHAIVSHGVVNTGFCCTTKFLGQTISKQCDCRLLV
jgi:hypothetical protein